MTVTAEPAATPTTSVFHGVEETDDNRWYLIDDLRLISASTVAGIISKDALTRWAAKLAAEAAFAELPVVVIASRIKPCGNTGSKCAGEGGHDTQERCDRCPCLECKACMTRWLASRHTDHTRRRADEGTRTHDVAEWWSLHGEIRPYDADITPYVKAFQAFTVEYGLTPDDFLVSEAIVVNRADGYAGTTDGVLIIRADRTDAAAKLVSRVTGIPWKQAKKRGITVVLVIDFKTREGEGPQFYAPQALQLTAYRHAKTIRIKGTDIEQPMIPTDGGMLVQLRPDGFTARLVLTDEDTYRSGFLPALATALWVFEQGPASISSRTFVLPETLAARRRKAEREAAEAAVAPQTITHPAA
ncbi:hypothetical protein C1I95_25760 [Micromonospora craterilacus]|uniref:Uncharacterized protein n=1 Tax=Micromonospora craterilacus TaxID=1655439 RepID=A0A2W2ESW7_9ACTN|nr:hypothetical protein [Micromonospora craterilacus]PZG12457.1 hypothetical protein C1I95_25760 [Micromonospora craterilacus]